MRCKRPRLRRCLIASSVYPSTMSCSRVITPYWFRAAVQTVRWGMLGAIAPKSPQRRAIRPRLACLRVKDLVKQALAEDVGKGDATSKLTVPRDAEARARID